MKLLYLSEHHSCFNYGIKIDSGFTQYRLAGAGNGQICYKKYNTDWLRKNPDRLIIVVVFVFYFF